MIRHLRDLQCRRDRRRRRTMPLENESFDVPPWNLPMACMRTWALVRSSMSQLSLGRCRDFSSGIPMLASNYIPDGLTVHLQSENGILGLVRGSVGVESVESLVDLGSIPLRRRRRSGSDQCGQRNSDRSSWCFILLQ